MTSGSDESKNIGVAVRAILYSQEGKVLVIKRGETAPSRPLYWDLPGGILEIGEEVEAGAIRETKEETDLDIVNPKLFAVGSGLNDQNYFWVTICFVASPSSDKVVLSYEHIDYRWIDETQLDDLKMSPRNKQFIEKFFKEYGNNKEKN